MSDGGAKYGILAAVDGSPASDAALAWAAHEAHLHHTGLSVLHVVTPVVVGWPADRLFKDMPDWQADRAQAIIAQARAVLDSSGAEPPEVHTEVIYANVVETLIGAAGDARMIVVGSRGLGAVGRLLLGSVTTSLLQHARCPVAVIRAGQEIDYRAPVLLGVDGSPASEAAIALAFDEASRRGTQLVALHAWSDVGVFPVLGMDRHRYESEGEEILAERLAGWQEQYPDVAVRRLVVCDQPAHWLLEEAEQAQMVVVGCRGRGGFPGLLLGSVSSAVAQSADAPVIVVRSRVD